MRRVILLLGTLLFLGCSHKSTNIDALIPAKVSDPAIRNIAIAKFKNDDISQRSQIISKMDNLIINGKKYFNIVDRENLNTLLKEIKLQQSGITQKKIEFEGFENIRSIMLGNVLSKTTHTSYYQEKRTSNNCIQWRGKYCVRYATYTVSCKEKSYSITTAIKIIKVANGSIIFANTYTATDRASKCEDESYTLPNPKEEYINLASYVANQLIEDIAPHYTTFYVRLIDDLDVDLDNDKLFDVSVDLIQKNRIQKAMHFLNLLNQEAKNRSYAILYDLGVCYESTGDYKKALSLYKKAEDLYILKEAEINEDIEDAIKRVTRNIYNREKALKQLNNEN